MKIYISDEERYKLETGIELADYTQPEGHKDYDYLSAKLPKEIIVSLCIFLHPRFVLTILPLVSKGFNEVSSDDEVWRPLLNESSPGEEKTITFTAKNQFKQFPAYRVSMYTLIGANGYLYFSQKMSNEIQETIAALKKEDKEQGNNANSNLIDTLSYSGVNTIIYFRLITLAEVCKLKASALRNLRDNKLFEKFISPLLIKLKDKCSDEQLRASLKTKIQDVLKVERPQTISSEILSNYRS